MNVRGIFNSSNTAHLLAFCGVQRKVEGKIEATTKKTGDVTNPLLNAIRESNTPLSKNIRVPSEKGTEEGVENA